MSESNKAGGRQRPQTWAVSDVQQPEVSGKALAEINRRLDQWLAAREQAAPTQWQRWQGSNRGKRKKEKNQ